MLLVAVSGWYPGSEGCPVSSKAVLHQLHVLLCSCPGVLCCVMCCVWIMLLKNRVVVTMLTVIVTVLLGRVAAYLHGLCKLLGVYTKAVVSCQQATGAASKKHAGHNPLMSILAGMLL